MLAGFFGARTIWSEREGRRERRNLLPVRAGGFCGAVGFAQAQKRTGECALRDQAEGESEPQSSAFASTVDDERRVSIRY